VPRYPCGRPDILLILWYTTQQSLPAATLVQPATYCHSRHIPRHSIPTVTATSQRPFTLQVGTFRRFYRLQRPLGWVELQLYSVLELGTRRGWGVSVTPRPVTSPGKDPVPITQETGCAPGPVWTGAENLVPPVFDPPTVQPRSQSLYRLSYPGPHVTLYHIEIYFVVWLQLLEITLQFSK
jgi:hypothetical protein